MTLPSLAALGIDPVTAAVYEFVLTCGDTVDVAAIASARELDDAVVVTALEQLRNIGLVHRTAEGHGRQAPGYGAVDPRVAVSALVAAHDEQLADARTAVSGLGALFDDGRRVADPSGTTTVLTGHAAVGDWYSRLQHRARGEFLAFDRPPYVVATNESVERGALNRGVHWRAIYTVASFTVDGSLQGVHRLGADGEEARVTHDLPVKLAIADRQVALVSVGPLDDPTAAPEALLTESPALIAALCDLFESRWRTAVPVPALAETAGAAGEGAGAAVDWSEVAARLAAATQGSGPGVPSDVLGAAGGRVSADGPPDPTTGLRAPTVDERDLLAFVAAGATDDVIARQLGISPRTLRRRLHDLFDELGASNRFHAGVEAARRGWV
ncbi:helix-turn-helix transcriptional regulator [Frigoribacterium sp. PhB116]|uniref:helix-turn-helix domain-containing protein n=1 Tax=Frigoribacterium sp. PhB116 TaxID=2485174 RepID=UPI0010E5D3C2|nr:helix-turn-helix transcriptional regulator [Frigoribacterium sp. PhB116]TDT66323.1 regulatory LuxR family protein [Frigoribacterium sp. PhB116]